MSGHPPSVRPPVTPALAGPPPLCRLGPAPPPECLWGRGRGCVGLWLPGLLPLPAPHAPLLVAPQFGPWVSLHPLFCLCSPDTRWMTSMRKAKSECAGLGGVGEGSGRGVEAAGKQPPSWPWVDLSPPFQETHPEPTAYHPAAPVESQPGDGPGGLVSEGTACAGPVPPDHLLLPCPDPHAPTAGKVAPKGGTDRDAGPGQNRWVMGSPAASFLSCPHLPSLSWQSPVCCPVSPAYPLPAGTLQPCPLGQCQPPPTFRALGSPAWNGTHVPSGLTFALRQAAPHPGPAFQHGLSHPCPFFV